MSSISQAIDALNQLADSELYLRRGIEKEGMRVTATGEVSQRLHPSAMGSTLTHPYITTDYSEALLEFITPVFKTTEEALGFLDHIQTFSANNMDSEMIWPASMPPKIENELDIPIAEYGTSNVGQMKHIYRHGLWHRYGRVMQSIAGLHYNFSVPESWWPVLYKQDDALIDLDQYISKRYFGLIRNFRRHSWVLFYLFGASPVLDKSFVQGNNHDLETLSEDTLYLPYATSLRMSDLGYQNNAQASLFVCYNSINTYIDTLSNALKLKHPDFEAIGLKDGEQYKQLNTSLLQIENEYYSEIRPKRVTHSGEKPLQALKERGVQYIEVRCLDLDPFDRHGIKDSTAYFLDTFLTYCLLSSSPIMTDADCDEAVNNQKRTIYHGRKPDLTLALHGKEIDRATLGHQLFDELTPIAEWLDSHQGNKHHQEALKALRPAIDNPDLTLSGQVLTQVKQLGSAQTWTLEQAKKISQQWRDIQLPEKVQQEFIDAAAESLRSQKSIEAEDQLTFDEYLAKYMAS